MLFVDAELVTEVQGSLMLFTDMVANAFFNDFLVTPASMHISYLMPIHVIAVTPATHGIWIPYEATWDLALLDGNSSPVLVAVVAPGCSLCHMMVWIVITFYNSELEELLLILTCSN
jgi:hypothetical protein